jgi:predicted permease
MTMMTRWWRRLWLLGTRRAAERAMDDEMRFHLERQAEELVQQGMSPRHAWREARLRFGGIDRFQEEGRDARGVRPIEDLMADLRYAWRSLRGAPGFTFVAVLTLGLGIGANTAVFSVVNGVVLRPLPYPEPERVLNVGWVWGGGSTVMGALSAYKLEYWRRHSRSFEAVATHRELETGLGERGEGGDVGMLRVTEDFFRVVGFHPRLGRAFTREEMTRGGPSVALVGDAFWRERLGGGAEVIGSEIVLGGVRYLVVGVMPPDFAFPPSAEYTDVLVPLALVADPGDNSHNYPVIVRLAPGVTRAAAEADLRRVMSQFEADHPELLQTPGQRPAMTDYFDMYLGPLQGVLWILLGAVAVVLLIACANVANLLLVRGTSRRRELAIRATLGAARGRIVRQALTESLLLATLGGAVGLILGGAGVKALIALAPIGIRRLEEVSVDGHVLLFTLLVTLLTGLLFGVIAALPAARVDLVSSIREGQRAAGTSRSRRRGRDLLVVTQAALAMMLLAAAALLINSFLRLRGTDLGFDPDPLVTVSFRRPPPSYTDPGRIISFEREFLARLARLPGVEIAAAASSFPLERGWNIPMTVEGRPDATEGGAQWRGVSPEYFEALGLRVVRGRAFTEAEVESGRPVIMLNESFAQRYFPDGDAIGQRIHVGYFKGEPISPGWNDPPREIVGIVSDMRESGPAGAAQRTMFVPHTQSPAGMMSVPRFLLRTRGPVAVEAINAAVLDVDPIMTVPTVRRLTDQLGATLAPARFSSLLMSLFAGAALVLTAIGIYGVVGYVVRQQTAEIGVRMALGAARRQVLLATLVRGMIPVVVGLVLGILGAIGISRFLSGMLYGVSATDPMTLLIVTVIIGSIAALACYIPARRAAGVHPMIALRSE